jgi:hypothetical protein
LPCQRQSDGNTIPKTINRTIAPLITVPKIAARRFLFCTHATMLTMSASGGVKIIASPPRAVMGDPHPGCNRTISAIVAGAARDKYSPTLPAFSGPGLFPPAWSFGASIQGDSSLTSIGGLMVSTGARLNWTLMVTILPTNSWGTRHECEQTPLHPNSMLPESTVFPSAVMMA